MTLSVQLDANWSLGTVQSFLDTFTIFLTATDSDGLQTTTELSMFAEQVELSFDAPVESAFYEFDEKTQSGDFTFESTVGFVQWRSGMH